MKKLKYIAAILSVIIALLMSIDDSFSMYFDIHATEMPLQSDCSDASHFHPLSLTDHFFHKASASGAAVSPAILFQISLNDKPVADLYLTSIWQPPKKG